MYEYVWDKKTRGYQLTTRNGRFIATELRPVFAEELDLIGFADHFRYEHNEQMPLMWARNNVYIYNGEEVAKLNKTQFGKPLDIEYLVPPMTILPVDVAAMLAKNEKILETLVNNTLKRIKEIYEKYRTQSDIVYIAFSGGKDSVLLLDLCHRVLPLTVPVIFSDTTMELPDTYEIWTEIQQRYPQRKFLKFTASTQAISNWKIFGPPSRTLDWCCAVHKSTPAILELKNILHLNSVRALAFLGIRSDESLKRDSYDSDVGFGVKNASQINAMPIESWGTQELFLYYFKYQLPLHKAYRKGVPRVGCIMCPKASDKYAWFVDHAYPGALTPFKETIIATSTKNFQSNAEAEDYISCSGWQARRNGLEVVGRIFPLAEKACGNTISWTNINIPYDRFFQWTKTFSEMLHDENGKIRLACSCVDLKGCSYEISLVLKDQLIQDISFTLSFANSTQKKKMSKLLRETMNKSVACVGCRACEAECAFGALKISKDGVQVDYSKCAHCLKCYDIDQGCWRYKSMIIPQSSDTPLKSIANYQNFGLRETWIQLYCEERQNFLSTTALGKPMIDSARIWFKQSLLTNDSRTLQPSKLLDVAVNLGAENDLFWTLIWIALCNNSPLIKWFVANIPLSQSTTTEEITEKLGDLSPSTKRGGLQAMYNFFKSSPIGKSENPLVELNQKGVRVLGLKRVPRSIEPLAVLYSLYLMAKVAGRTSFTVSEMMTADFDSPYISPLIAFGMSVEEFKGQCMGIASIYPDFLSCTFTLGLDEVKVFPNEKSLDDVIGLILGE